MTCFVRIDHELVGCYAHVFVVEILVAFNNKLKSGKVYQRSITTINNCTSMNTLETGSGRNYEDNMNISCVNTKRWCKYDK